MAIKSIKILIVVFSIIIFSNCRQKLDMTEKEAIESLKSRGYEDFGYTLDENKEYVVRVRIQNSNNLTEFPEELKAFKNLKTLRLELGQITEIPEFITEFDSLEALSVGGNPIKELPDYIVNCKKLDALNISGTNISSFPPHFEKLPITGLFLNNSAIKGFPTILYEFDSLTNLGLNQIDELPSDIDRLKFLITLTVKLKSFKYIDKLTSLKILTLNGSTATHLPKDFGNLQDLHTIELAECKNLVRLPESMSEFKGLYGLTLNGCIKLTGLPKGLTKTPIGILELDRCFNLRTVPKGLRISSIWAVDTKWKTIPSGIFYSNAHSLNIINHEVTNIIGIGNMYNLTHCNLSNGKIKYIPDDIGKLKELVHLNLENNDIEHYNSALNNCPKLNTVGLFGNPVFDVEAIED